MEQSSGRQSYECSAGTERVIMQNHSGGDSDSDFALHKLVAVSGPDLI